MATSSSKSTNENIWDQITLSQLTTAIVSLGDRIEKLTTETWRLNDETRGADSIWKELILLLKLDQTESSRRSLYNIWHKNRHQIQDLVETATAAIPDNEEEDIDDNSARGATSSDSSRKQSPLQPLTSSPIPVRPKRHLQGNEDVDADRKKGNVVNDHSIAFTAVEWKAVYSRTDRKMKAEWTTAFAAKLRASGFVCTLRFKSPSFKKGERKKNCRFWCCYAKCTTTSCSRGFHIILRDEPSAGTALLFLVRTFGEENHDAAVEVAARPLKGEERLLVGKWVYFLWQYRI